MDLYAVLELERDASPDDIKRAYRSLALRWHPDRNPDSVEEATERFKLLAEAYEILGDPHRRAQYDFDQQRASAPVVTHLDPFEVFQHFFGYSNPFGNMHSSILPFARSSPFDHPFFSQPLSLPFPSAFPHTMHHPYPPGPFMNCMPAPFRTAPFVTPISSAGAHHPSNHGTSTQTSSQTSIVDGKRITRSVTTTTMPNGACRRTTNDVIEDLATGAVSSSSSSESWG